ncbi:hypothetical protein U9M48_033685 [Paspalum notatum var. saurae]|uniref:Uncharacterized protein n=1 Tax=Paspalum notatum var. saurae TaxID=547442 RepID=A0AAQ3UAP7_PASNO
MRASALPNNSLSSSGTPSHCEGCMSDESRVGSLAWNNSMMTTGSMDGKIVNNDTRIRNNRKENGP